MKKIFQYTAIAPNRKHVVGTVSSVSEYEAIAELSSKQRYDVISINYIGDDTSAFIADKKALQPKAKVSAQDVYIFTKEFSLMVEAGIPLERCLTVLSDFQDNLNFKLIIQSIQEELSKGHPLSYAFGKHPAVFTPVYTALLKIGETTGKMPYVLDELTNYLERELNTMRKVKSAMTYPVFVMGSTILVLGLIMVYYLPGFVAFLDGMDGKMPMPTKILISITNIMQNPFIVGGVIMGLLLLYYIYYNFSHTMVGKSLIDTIKLKLPVIGNFYKSLYMWQFSRFFSLMYKSGVDINQILVFTKDIIPNTAYKDTFEECRIQVSEGEPFDLVVRSKQFIPGIFYSFVRLGIETDELAYAMEKVSVIYEDQINLLLETIMTLIEPVFMVLVSVVVGFVVISLFLPMYSLISNMG